VDTQTVIGTLFVALMLAAGLVVAYYWGRLAGAARECLLEAVLEITDDPKASASDRRIANALWSRARSFADGWLIVRALSQAMLATPAELDAARRRAEQSGGGRPQLQLVLGRFALSVLFANPFAALLCALMIVALACKALLNHQRAKSAIGNATAMINRERLHLC